MVATSQRNVHDARAPVMVVRMHGSSNVQSSRVAQDSGGSQLSPGSSLPLPHRSGSEPGVERARSGLSRGGAGSAGAVTVHSPARGAVPSGQRASPGSSRPGSYARQPRISDPRAMSPTSKARRDLRRGARVRSDAARITEHMARASAYHGAELSTIWLRKKLLTSNQQPSANPITFWGFEASRRSNTPNVSGRDVDALGLGPAVLRAISPR